MILWTTKDLHSQHFTPEIFLLLIIKMVMLNMSVENGHGDVSNFIEVAL